jgi:hypothetical protein
MDIQTQHMKHRCYFIFAMCNLSLYGWCNYSLFEPYTNSFFTPYYQNGLLFLFYLLWDTYHMTTSPVLYRTDLIIHHIMAFVFTASAINTNSLAMSNYMILECISLMNYLWRNKPQFLKIYRTCCICIIRTPLTLWFWYYYTYTVMYPVWKESLTYGHCLYLKTLFDMSLVFMFYDMYILWQLYKPKKIKT